MSPAVFVVATFAMLVSTLFFVGGKLVIARGQLSWATYWCWCLGTTGLVGGVAWVLQGAPTAGWGWLVAAGTAGAMAHICANLAMSWGDASLLVPISGAKPLILIALTPLFTSKALTPAMTLACLIATVGVGLVGLAPRNRHRHSPRPLAAMLLMMVGTFFMALSDIVGAKGMAEAGEAGRLGALALWNASLGIFPIAFFILRRPVARPTALVACSGLGLLFAGYIVLMAMAFALSPDRGEGVAGVNLIISFRGVSAILLVLALDRVFSWGLEPIPRWVHGIRLAGAVLLGLAVIVAA